MKYFMIGFPRTGTTSFHSACELLGFKSKHLSMKAMESYINRSDFCYEEIEKFDCFSDAPYQLFYKELFYELPETKFVLTYRDEEDWLKSIKKLFYFNISNEAWVDKPGNEFHINFLQRLYGSEFFDKELWLNSYRNYNREVVNFFNKRGQDRLFTINMSDVKSSRVQFNNLARFMGKEPLGVPFPHKNKGSVEGRTI